MISSYRYEDGKPCVCRDKVIETANIFTTNIPEKWLDEWKYPLFDEAAKRTHRASQFPIDLANSRALCKQLVANAKAHFH